MPKHAVQAWCQLTLRKDSKHRHILHAWTHVLDIGCPEAKKEAWEEGIYLTQGQKQELHVTSQRLHGRDQNKTVTLKLFGTPPTGINTQEHIRPLTTLAVATLEQYVGQSTPTVKPHR